MMKKGHIKAQLTSSDIGGERLQELRRIFPEAFSEGKIDLEKLRAVLGDAVDARLEKFGFTWAGKMDAIKNILMPSKLTLKPKKDESVKFDESEHIFIEGDNLEVLKLLQKSYFEKVKMIYIDPPYNTGGDFVYKDNFKAPLESYKEQTGQKNSNGEKLQTNSETNGRFHSDWLSMMYPRLKLAWNLLREDGVIFVSIDDNEVHHLRMVMDEIFGEENFRNQILVRRRVKSLNLQFVENGLRTMNIGAEYVLVYAKSEKFLFQEMRLDKENSPTKGVWNVFWSGADRPTMRYELLGFTPTTGQWRWSKEKALEAIRNYQYYEENFSGKLTLEEYYLETGEKLKFVRRIKNGKGKNGGVQYWMPPSSTALRTSDWTDIEVSEIHKDFDLSFDNPKSIKLLKSILNTTKEKDFLILDFFAGSGTTAHAVLKQNQEDGGNRKFICVQLPEKTDAKSEARKAGFGTIADIAKERIRRVIAGYGKDPKPIDDGFKVFKLDESTYQENGFDFDPKRSEEENEAAFKEYLGLVGQTSLFEDVSDVDVIYENIVKEGLSLNAHIEEIVIADSNAYRISDGDRELFVCLENAISSETVRAFCDKEYQEKTLICIDSALDDSAKANLALHLVLKTI
jgi:adenine-specific DNA-methyltransferase